MEKVHITLTLYYEIIGSEVYGREIGYAEQKMDLETSGLGNIKLLEAAQSAAEGIAGLCRVPIENVRIISRTEYDDNVEENDCQTFKMGMKTGKGKEIKTVYKEILVLHKSLLHYQNDQKSEGVEGAIAVCRLAEQFKEQLNGMISLFQESGLLDCSEALMEEERIAREFSTRIQFGYYEQEGRIVHTEKRDSRI